MNAFKNSFIDCNRWFSFQSADEVKGWDYRAFVRVFCFNRGLWHQTNRYLQNETFILVFWHLMCFDIQPFKLLQKNKTLRSFANMQWWLSYSNRETVKVQSPLLEDLCKALEKLPIDSYSPSESHVIFITLLMCENTWKTLMHSTLSHSLSVSMHRECYIMPLLTVTGAVMLMFSWWSEAVLPERVISKCTAFGLQQQRTAFLCSASVLFV